MSDRASVTGGVRSVRGWRWRVAAVALIAPASVLGVVGLAGRSTGPGKRACPPRKRSPRYDARRATLRRAGERIGGGLRATTRGPWPLRPELLDMFFHAVHGRPEILRRIGGSRAVGPDPVDARRGPRREPRPDRPPPVITCTALEPEARDFGRPRDVRRDHPAAHSRNERNEHLDLRIGQLDQARMDAERLLKDRRNSLLASLAKLPPDESLAAASPAAAVEGLREVRRELRRVRLEKKAAEVRLARQKSTDAGNATSGKTLEETVAVLDGQEELLRRDETEGIEAIGARGRPLPDPSAVARGARSHRDEESCRLNQRPALAHQIPAKESFPYDLSI